MLKRLAPRVFLPAAAAIAVLAISLLAPSPARIFGIPVASCGYSYGIGSGPSPVVTGVSPNYGSASGGTAVAITGTGFCNNTTVVDFNTTAAPGFTLYDDNHITATSPAGTAGTVDITVINGEATSLTSAADHFTYRPDIPGVYHALNPLRILDTRGNGSTLGPGGSYNLAVGGISVPANATSVELNVTATDTTSAGFFTLYPAGGGLPTASNLNWFAGQTIPNLVSVKLGAGGVVSIYNGLGRADAVVDLEGYFAPPASGGDTTGQFTSLNPARITDTRTGSAYPNAGSHLGPNSSLDVQVTGVGGVPLAGATAVVMNVTVTSTTAASDLTVYPTLSPRPTASNLNWTAGVTIPNRVTVPIGAGGKVTVYNAFGVTDVVIDVNGFYTDGTLTGTVFTALTPSRIMDTRGGLGGFQGQLGPGQTALLQVDGQGGVPAATGGSTDPLGFVLNVTITGATAPSYLTIYPNGTSMPTASDVNFVGGQTIANLVVVGSGGGSIQITNGLGQVYVVVDVDGWYA